VGALTTALVVLVVASMKFLEGVWIVVVVVPMMVVVFIGISHHYKHTEMNPLFLFGEDTRPRSQKR
jgi:uncharacterized membrane protein YkvI